MRISEQYELAYQLALAIAKSKGGGVMRIGTNVKFTHPNGYFHPTKGPRVPRRKRSAADRREWKRRRKARKAARRG